MKKSLPPATRFALAAVAAFLLLASAAPDAKAQARLPPQRDKEVRGQGSQNRVRELGKKTADPTYLNLRMEQINEDFAHLKEANNEILKLISSRTEMNFRRVSELTGEVKARGEHLKQALALPKPEEEKKDEDKGPTAEQMKSYLTALTDLIASFVTNPVFKSEKEIDKNQAAQASRDLEDLIALSEVIRKSAARLDKVRAR
ncbi:MAG TPA: hypothetical protein VFX96_18015 [Pyrinomonadaceae bacterium]|nr:hypothetical protein [Pyrinomonadaceae bacterium]